MPRNELLDGVYRDCSGGAAHELKLIDFDAAPHLMLRDAFFHNDIRIKAKTRHSRSVPLRSGILWTAGRSIAIGRSPPRWARGPR